VIYLLALGAAVIIVVYGFRGAARIGWLSPDSSENQQAEKISQADAPRFAAADPKPLRCPPAGVPTLQPSSLTGHHKVTLRWNASIPSSNVESKAFGYCLYRSKKRKAAKQNPTCSDCEQINSIPVAGTGCVDDLVEDGAAYYYVATAINANERISSSSNETTARIPLGKPASSSGPAGSYPRCRATAP
jgi:hypothetical protein